MPIVTCKFLAGQRLGNAMFIYAFCRGYAEKFGCELQTPKWAGQQIFENINEPEISVDLPTTEMDSANPAGIGSWFGQTGIDIASYCQHQKFLDFYSRTKLREWFKLKPEFERYAPHGTEYSAAHIRRGDYVTDAWLHTKYCEVSEASYDRAIKQFKIPQPVIKIQEGWRPPFKELEARGIGWLPDWLLLRNASYLLRGNSSFSWWAAALGNGQVYSPVVEDRVGLQDVAFERGNEACTAGQFKNQSRLMLRE